MTHTHRTEQQISDSLLVFLRETLLPAGTEVGLDENTPLLETGLLDSIRTAMLMNFVRNELGVQIAIAGFTVDDFATVKALTEMVSKGLAAQAGRADGAEVS